MVAQFGTLGQAVLTDRSIPRCSDRRPRGRPPDTSDLGTDGGHDAGVLMAEHDRRHGGRTGAAGVQVAIGAAHAGVGGVISTSLGWISGVGRSWISNSLTPVSTRAFMMGPFYGESAPLRWQLGRVTVAG